MLLYPRVLLKEKKEKEKCCNRYKSIFLPPIGYPISDQSQHVAKLRRNPKKKLLNDLACCDWTIN